MRRLLMIMLLGIMLGCDQAPPQQPCPEVPECECPEVPPTEPPVDEPDQPDQPDEPQEPVGPQPQDYLVLSRAQSELDRFNGEGIRVLLRDHIWSAARNPRTAVQYCSGAFGDLFPISAAETTRLTDSYEQYHLNPGQRMQDRLGTIEGTNRITVTVNKRCKPTHPQHDPAFCGRSDVRKDALADVKSNLRAQIAWGNQFNTWMPEANKGPCQDSGGYDNVAGWCKKCGKW